MEVIKDRIVVFANVRSDINALEIGSSHLFRDIQSFFRVYNPTKRGYEPKSLDFLIEYVLLKKSREKSHCPTNDARLTLQLYQLIPKEHWVT